jgi:hypothetical protein
MKFSLAGSGWLWVAVLAAVLVWSGILNPLLSILDGDPPSARERALLGLLFAGCFLGLYFRSHWAFTLGELEATAARHRQAARRIREAAADLERSAHVVADNLAEVGPDTPHGDLYLGGARAHARKLPEVAARLRGAASDLNPDAHE